MARRRVKKPTSKKTRARAVNSGEAPDSRKGVVLAFTPRKFPIPTGQVTERLRAMREPGLLEAPLPRLACQ